MTKGRGQLEVLRRAAGSILLVALGASAVLGTTGCSGADDSNPKKTPRSTRASAPTGTSTTTTIVNPSDLPKVDASTARADLDHLSGRGKNLVAMSNAVDLATANGQPPDDAACSKLLESLSDAGSPRDLAELIEPITDEVLRGALQGIRSAAVAIVAGCEQKVAPGVSNPDRPGLDEAIRQGANATSLLQQRMAQIKESG